MRRLGLAAIYQRPNTSKPAAGHKIYPYLPPNSPAKSATVRSPLMAANATFALNAALCFFRVCFMSCSRAICAF
jgi:hypothetical protein